MFDPKPEPRVKDTHALSVARLMSDECAACGGQPGSVHHVIARGAPHHGDDVVENCLVVCGDGTKGCHGAYHGTPYEVEIVSALRADPVERRDAEWVRSRLGLAIEQRPDIVEYVLGKLGDGPGRYFLETHYYLTLP